MKYLEWLVDTEERLITADGKTVQVFEFCHRDDDEVLSDWAKHFRNHYCLDSEIDTLRKSTGYSRAEYLNEIKFPDSSVRPGPSIRAGDFGEILLADYLQFILNHWVPRTRYADKSTRNESTKGCDIIGFKIIDESKSSAMDTLSIIEVKAQLSKGKPQNRLRDALQDSMKDVTRKAESLNSIKQRLLRTEQAQLISRVERFQNPIDRPYKEISGAAALFSTVCYSKDCISEIDASDHPNEDDLMLIIIHGKDMMKLANELYGRAADEA